MPEKNLSKEFLINSFRPYQLQLIADPYSDHMFLIKNDSEEKKDMFEM